MKSPISDYLTEIITDARSATGGGGADYIPVLSEVDRELLGAALCTASGDLYSVGDDEHAFSIQSISKPFAYAVALEERGPEVVDARVGMEPSGEAFNDISLDEETGRPDNPMINVGAIAVTQLIGGRSASVDSRVGLLLDRFSALAGRQLSIDERVAESELAHSDYSMAMAYMLRDTGVVTDTAEHAVTSYIRQCAVLVTVRDLAVMAATLANGGIQPITGQRVFSQAVCRQVQAVMASAGMYNAAGRWMTTVGIPAKSGVAGGLLGTLPRRLGLATFSPPLDPQGNSVRGVKIFQRLSEDMGMHLMGAEPTGDTAVREVEVTDAATTIALQGPLDFNGGEAFLRAAVDCAVPSGTVVVDLARVGRVHDVGRRMILEGMRRLRGDGHRVMLRDPEGRLPGPDLGDGTRPETPDPVA